MSNTRLEPWDEKLSKKGEEKVKLLTEVTHKATDNMEYNLATDVLKVPGQNWVCVSFVSPDGNQKNNSLGMKIRGVFDQHTEAVEHVKRLIRLDPAFDIYICEMYNWCLIPPDPEKIKDQTYQNEELNKIVSEYRKNQIYAKEHFEERKRELVEQAADEARNAALKSLESVNEESGESGESEEVPPEPEPAEIVNNTLEFASTEPSTPSSIMDSMVSW